MPGFAHATESPDLNDSVTKSHLDEPRPHLLVKAIQMQPVQAGRVSGSAAIGARDLLSSWRAETAGVHLPGIGVAARFGSPEQAEFAHGQRRTADSLVSALATKAGMLVMP